jgi:uncharacterized metal-binding protein
MGKFALLIGVSESRAEDLPALPSAIEDIRAMEAVLRNPLLGGFDGVEVLPNPTRQEMEEAIETLFANRKQEDLVLFYFSGHGILDEKSKFYLVTPQTRKNRGELVKTTAVAASVLQDNMGDSRSKRQVLILDACHSGAVADGITVKSAGRKVDIQRELGGEGRAILTSSNVLEDSFHVEGYDLSIYTHYLIEGIQTGDANQDGGEYITVEELHTYVKERLEKAALKMPSQFKMSPQFLPMREGYKIRLVRSTKPKVDPELEYRKEEKIQTGLPNQDHLRKVTRPDWSQSKQSNISSAKKWKAADEETEKCMLKVMERHEYGWLRVEDIRNFPSLDLININSLWLNHSQQRFGFSMQKNIWLSYGSPTSDNRDWRSFGTAIGWRTKGTFGLGAKWCLSQKLIYKETAPRGHLPYAATNMCWIISQLDPSSVQGLMNGGHIETEPFNQAISRAVIEPGILIAHQGGSNYTTYCHAFFTPILLSRSDL